MTHLLQDGHPCYILDLNTIKKNNNNRGGFLTIINNQIQSLVVNIGLGRQRNNLAEVDLTTIKHPEV